MNKKLFERVWLDHVVLRARDAGVLVRFYSEVFGAHIERQLGAELFQLRMGEILIDIIPFDSPLGKLGGSKPDEGRNMDHFCIRVEPFDEREIRAHLNRFNIQVGLISQVYGADGFGPSLYVTDPEGNRIELKGPPSSNLHSDSLN
jgi:glyoxylase I family protein